MQGNLGDLVGQRLGTCVLEKLIGKGGMGAVFLARQQRPVRHVAVKVLLPHLTGGEDDSSQQFLERFRREADVVARLEHMNIVPIYEYEEQDGLAYLVMPYLAGGSLSSLLLKHGALPLSTVVTYLDQAASALDYAHAQGVIHRDLKPANFLLHADGRLMLTDFGIARLMEETVGGGATLTKTGMTLGTPDYMAPEMALGEPIDYRADIYELGVVLFTLLSGHVPFSGSNPVAVITKHLSESMPLLHQQNPAIPAAVDDVIRIATAKQREQRYSSAHALSQALHAALIPSTTVYSASHREPEYRVPVITTVPVDIYTAPAQAYLTEPQLSADKDKAVPQTTNPPHFLPPHLSTPSSGTQRRGRAWLLPLGITCALLLVLGSVFVGTRLQLGGTDRIATHATQSPSSGSTATVRAQTPQGSTVATMAAPNATAKPTKATAPTATPAPPQVPNTVPGGAVLYTTAAPGPNCDRAGGAWVNYNGAQITCQQNKTQITNTATTKALQGIFLTAIPGQPYPTDYAINVEMQQSSASNFGLYFRNQPGNQQGTYSFLVQPDGTWGAFVYDNTTGVPRQLAGGMLGDVNANVKLAVVVKGALFTFYANGQQLGSVSDATYPTGTVGIAVDQGGSITVSNFSFATP